MVHDGAMACSLCDNWSASQPHFTLGVFTAVFALIIVVDTLVISLTLWNIINPNPKKANL